MINFIVAFIFPSAVYNCEYINIKTKPRRGMKTRCFDSYKNYAVLFCFVNVFALLLSRGGSTEVCTQGACDNVSGGGRGPWGV